jgi:hypothetical protein
MDLATAWLTGGPDGFGKGDVMAEAGHWPKRRPMRPARLNRGRHCVTAIGPEADLGGSVIGSKTRFASISPSHERAMKSRRSRIFPIYAGGECARHPACFLSGWEEF